jgi:hypothetical protein
MLQIKLNYIVLFKLKVNAEKKVDSWLPSPPDSNVCYEAVGKLNKNAISFF